MTERETNFEIPANIERYLATLSKFYARKRQKLLEKIIVNAQVQVTAEYTYDNWNGGTYGHALYLSVPESIYPSIKDKRKIENRIRDDLNAVHNVSSEHIAAVLLEMETAADHDWRKDSDQQISTKRVVSSSITDKIWGTDGYRIFLSHKTEVKVEAAELKEKLKLYGVSAFVAHEDITPTKEWQREIENALSTMDALVALMTEDFHDSLWTDQEIGFAFGRNIPLIPVKMGKDPYGFIGKFQALSCPLEKTAIETVKILINQEEKMVNAFIKAISNCQSFNQGNTLAEILPHLNNLSKQQIDALISAYNHNSQARASYGLNGQSNAVGLVPHLKRMTGNEYRYSQSGEIEIAP